MLNIKKKIREHKNGSTLISLLIFSMLTMTMSTKSITLRPEEVLFSFISTIQRGFYEVGNFFSGTLNSINELSKLKDEYKKLQKEVDKYKINERNLVELRRENLKLTEQLELKKIKNVRYIAGEVCGIDPGNIFNTIQINKGVKDGIKKGMPVIAFQNGFQSLVGKVVEVGLLNSKVLPVYDSTCYISGRMQKTRDTGLINGKGYINDFLTMEILKINAIQDIEIGDLVVTSGMGTVYPKGIYVGRVRETIKNKDHLLLNLESMINFLRLEYVFFLDIEG